MEPQILDKYRIQYVLESTIDNCEISRYIQYVEGEILLKSRQPDFNFKTIGKAMISKIFLSKAIQNNIDLQELFRYNFLTYELSKVFFDFEKNKFFPKIDQIINVQNSCDILYLREFELLPEARKTGIGEYWLKNIYQQFGNGCQFMIVKALPSNEPISEYDTWGKSLNLSELKTDTELDRYKLYAYFQKLGFQNHFNNEFFFIDPSQKNGLMEKSNFKNINSSIIS